MSANNDTKKMSAKTTSPNEVLLFSGGFTSHMGLPFFSGGIYAGVPHAPQDFPGEIIDFNEHFIQHPDATFYARVDTDAMAAVGIMRGDLVVVDRAETPRHGDVVVFYADGAFRIASLDRSEVERGRVTLRQADPEAKVFVYNADSFQEWGVVICFLLRRK